MSYITSLNSKYNQPLQDNNMYMQTKNQYSNNLSVQDNNTYGQSKNQYSNNMPTNNIPSNIPFNYIPSNNIPPNNIPFNYIPSNNIPSNIPNFAYDANSFNNGYNQNIPTSNNFRYNDMMKKKYESFANNPSIENNKSSKFDWLKFGKSIIIYTILFLIMSHIKMNVFVCNFIPFLNNNEVLCMTVKGIIMSIIIIIIHKIL